MTTRLQVLLDDAEIEEIRRVARHHRMTVAEWVRQALRRARRDESLVEPASKLSAVREAARHSYPSGSMPEMLAEIERGYVTRDGE